MSPSASLLHPGCQWQMEKTGILDRLQTLLQKAHFADCSFRVGPDEHTAQEVYAHRLLLAAASPVFEAMLLGPLAETSAAPIRVPDLRPEAFRSVLEYVYTDRLRPDGASHALAVLYAANKYLLPGLAQLCRKYVMDNVIPEEALVLHESALSIHEESLLEPCLSAAAKYPKEAFGDSPDFEPATLCAFLQLERLNWSEEALVEATLRWASQRCQSLGIIDSPINRRQMLDDCGAIRLLRFGCLSRPQLERCALRSGLLNESEAATFPIQCPRGRMTLQIFHCNRQYLKRSLPMPGGVRLACILRVLERPVTLRGIGLTTRLPPPVLPMCSLNSLKYMEDLTINVIDAHGHTLTTKTFKEAVEHNMMTVISFSSIRLQPDHPYTIEVTLNADQVTEYPVNILSQRETNRGYIFEFVDLIGLPNNEFVERTNVGFIDSLVFSP